MDKIITSSLEDYLETIFVLKQKKDVVRVTDIAAEMNVSKPSVNRAVGNLKEAGLLSHESYGAVVLTEEGETLAAQVLHRHKLLKHFLTCTLGVEEKTAEEDACRVEHVISSETIDKLYSYLAGFEKTVAEENADE